MTSLYLGIIILFWYWKIWEFFITKKGKKYFFHKKSLKVWYFNKIFITRQKIDIFFVKKFEVKKPKSKKVV